MLLYCVWLACNTLCLTHGDLDRRISEFTQLILQHPDSLALFVSRGELYLQHEDFTLAYADFNHCLENGYETSTVYLGLSKSLVPLGTLDSSMVFVNKALELDPNWISAQEWKARLYFLMKNYCASASAYDTLIDQVDQPSPALFLDAANAWNNCTAHNANEQAIRTIQNGLARIGSLHVLQRKLVELYLNQKAYDEALKVQTELIEHATNTITALAERAAIFQAKGDITHARTDLYNALAELDALPASKAGTPAMTLLRQTIRQSIIQTGE